MSSMLSRSPARDAHLLAFCALLGAALSSLGALAEPVEAGNSEATRAVTLTDGPRLLPTVAAELYTPHLLTDDEATESWSYLFQFPSGHVIVAQFMVTNQGPGERRAGALGWLIQPDGRSDVGKNSRDKDDWAFTSRDDGMVMTVYKHRLQIEHPNHRLRMSFRQGTFEIEARSVTPALRIGRADYPGDDGGYVDTTVLGPRLEAHGVLRLPDVDGEIELVDGIGIAIHRMTDMHQGDRELASLRLDAMTDSDQLSLVELIAPTSHDAQRIGLLYVIEDDAIVHFTTDYQRTWTGFEVEAEKPGYKIPTGVHVHADGARTIDATIELRPVRRDKVLDFVNSKIARWVMRRRLDGDPVAYQMRAPYELALGEGDDRRELRGTGFATFSLVTSPPDTY